LSENILGHNQQFKPPRTMFSKSSEYYLIIDYHYISGFSTYTDGPNKK